MTYSVDFIARCFAAYHGADYLYGHDMFVITGDTVSAVQLRLNGAENYKPILIPLSKMNDKDALKCGNIMGLHSAGSKITRGQDGVFIENDTYQLVIAHSGYCCLRKNNQLYNANMRPVWDYLRHKHYDCGYAEVRSLIDAGIAVEEPRAIVK